MPRRHMGNGGMAPPFLTSALGEGEWSGSCPCHFTPEKQPPCTHCRPVILVEIPCSYTVKPLFIVFVRGLKKKQWIWENNICGSHSWNRIHSGTIEIEGRIRENELSGNNRERFHCIQFLHRNAGSMLNMPWSFRLISILVHHFWTSCYFSTWCYTTSIFGTT
jgi:hypothetical protein